jgi:hypothetical protein
MRREQPGESRRVAFSGRHYDHFVVPLFDWKRVPLGTPAFCQALHDAFGTESESLLQGTKFTPKR